MEQSKKYSEMTFEEFITDVLEFKPTEQQLRMIRMFEEIKIRKVEYINNNGILPTFRNQDVFPPKVMFTNTDAVGKTTL